MVVVQPVSPAPPLAPVSYVAPRREKRLVGRGRSAVVYRMCEERRRAWARKLFLGDPLAKLVHLALTGAPNPYGWSDDAVAAAVSRRRILCALVRHWFDDRLRLPLLYGASWNADERAYQIDMEFVDGRAPALRHHVTSARDDEMDELAHEIMAPLQGHLREAGFDGLVWQAGLGNPVASSNFLLSSGSPEHAPRRWIWVDLESGVPALFPLHPGTLLRFYLPKSIRHRGALFDDVDTETLHAYLVARRGELESWLGPRDFDLLLEETRQLETHQRRWKGLGRFRASLRHAERRGQVTAEQTAWYGTRPVRWYARLARRSVARLPGKIARGVRTLWRHVVPVSLAHSTRVACRFLFSQRWRARWAAWALRRRIRQWARRGQLSAEEAHHLSAHARSDEATAYLTDFAMHLAIKAPVKAIEWLMLPALFAAGLISEAVLLVGIATGGMIARTLYTTGRLVQASARGRERPWVALAAGLLPVVGNAAYPVQILYTSAERDHDVAKFMLIDLFTTVGRKIPIWGGPDTRTEHFFNRFAVALMPWLGRRPRAASSTSERLRPSPAHPSRA